MGIYWMPFKSNHFDYRISGKPNSTVNKDNRYKQFLMVLEMEDIPCEYSFYISEGMGYVMDEGGESAYAAWKEANKAKFIE